jgi:transposase-like protein
MKKQRKHHTPEEKVAILRRRLLEKEPISNLCDELGLQPTVFYRWQKEFFENGAGSPNLMRRYGSMISVIVSASGEFAAPSAFIRTRPT